MFKKYTFKWNNGDAERSVDFVVHSKATRSGFMHRAIAVGPVPRLDDIDGNFDKYRRNEDLLQAKRICRVSYINRTWEYWPGQTCLKRLWDNVSKLRFVDMGRITTGNPFEGREEPECEELYDPCVLFARRWR